MFLCETATVALRGNRKRVEDVECDLGIRDVLKLGARLEDIRTENGYILYI